MSFILDALRKSEHARQHQKGPALAEVPIVATKPKTNAWAAAAVALLIVNLIAVGVLMLRRAQRSDPAAVATAPATPVGSQADVAAGSNAVGAPATSPRPQPNPEPTLTSDPQVAVTQTPRGALQPIAPPASGTRNPLAAEVSEGSAGPDPEMAESAASLPPGPPAVTARGTSRPGSVTYATVPEADDAPYSPPAGSAAPPPRQQEALPTADEVVARGGVPPLHLDLHVYSDVLAQRFIFVNSRKYREGETLQEGPVVERITVDGAVLNFRGSRFKLSQD